MYLVSNFALLDCIVLHCIVLYCIIYTIIVLFLYIEGNITVAPRVSFDLRDNFVEVTNQMRGLRALPR